MNLNKVFVLGRVTADPQLRNTPGGQAVTSFSVATNRIWNDKSGQRKEETEFHNVVVWGRQAEIATQFLMKGSLVLIEGRLQTRSWQDKAGATRKTTEIICDRLQLGAKPQGGGFQKNPQAKTSSAASQTPEHEEEIPVIDIDGGDEIKSEDIPF